MGHSNGVTYPDCSRIWYNDPLLATVGFRRHFVGKTLINVFHCDIAEIRFVGKLVIIETFS